VHCGYRLQAVRAELDAGLERLADPLLATGALDEKSFDEMCTALERATEGANTVTSLVAVYRTLVSDIQVAMHNPTVARQDRGTRRALAFMSEHAAEPLTLAKVARAAGFAPDYFGRLFSRTEGMTFQHHLRDLRVARAKQVLKETSLSVDGVSQLVGFASRIYFHRAFKRVVGMTPIEYREQEHAFKDVVSMTPMQYRVGRPKTRRRA